MRYHQWFSCLAMFCLIVMLFSACGGNPVPSPSVITIDPTHAYPFEGWGTSLAWWAEAVGQWDASKRTALEDALFNPDKGLGLNVIRYNFGANTPDNKCPNTFRAFGSIDSYEPSDGKWNWSKDLAQLNVLTEAKSKGANIFEGFANSAPAWMLYNHCTQGNGSSDNLLLDDEQDYANYLATIVKHFHDDLHITLRTVEPFNEPDLSWAGTQEGMSVDLSQQKIVIQDLYTALQQNGASSYTSISAPDNNSIDSAFGTVGGSISYDPTTLGDISQLNTHSYNGTQRTDFYTIAHQNRKRVWMSEYTTTGTDDLGPKCVNQKASAKMIGALQLSCQISRDINLMHPSAWVYWQAVEDNAFGLLRASLGDLGKQDFTYNEQYYALWQYSHFIRPGYQIIQSNDSNNTVVAYDPSSHNLIIVELNDNPNTPRTVTYDLSNFSNTFRSATPYVTSASQNSAQQTSIPISGKQFTSTVPPNSITTYVITSAAVSVSPTPISSPTTVPMPPTQTSCPSPGTARAAVTAPLVLGTHPNIVYVYNVGTQQAPTFGNLKRYDVTTRQKTQIVALANTWISEAQLSPDGQWVLFISQVSGQSAIQMIRMDGQGLQTLYCHSLSGGGISSIQWSPNQNLVLFDEGGNGGASLPNISLLNISNGTLQQELLPQASTAFLARTWLDDTRAYVVDYHPTMDEPIRNLYLLDTSRGANQQGSSLQFIAKLSGIPSYGISIENYDLNPERTELFFNHCVCGLDSSTGPSTITQQSTTSSTPNTIYTNPTLAITKMRVLSSTSLLLLISNIGQDENGNPIDTSQNGIWKINTNGSGFTRLISSNAFFITLTSVSRDASSYTYVVTDTNTNTQSLFVASSGGGSPIMFASVPLQQSQLTNADLIGLVIAGWTTM